MRRLSILAMVLTCGACQPLPDATVTGTAAAAQNPDAQPSAAPPDCSSYTAPVTVGGQQQQAVVEACQQPDGSWRITQNTPGLPPQVYEVPAPTYSPYPYAVGYAYPDLFPYWGWAGSPWYLGLAPSIVVAQRFHHFNHGFHRGFHRGFAHGSGHGFGHRLAAAHAGGMAGGRR
jgi:surface antigen